MVALAVIAVVIVPGGRAAAAGTASVSITPVAASLASGLTETYTLTVTCSVTGGCNGTTVTFPTTAITGDPNEPDFGAWFGASSCSGVTKTVAAGTVTYHYGNIATGTSQCTFTVATAIYATPNGTQLTLTPTINGTNFTSDTGTASVLTVTAGHNTSVSKSGPSKVGTGALTSYAIPIRCGGQGAQGTASMTITDQLPTNFTYTGYTTDYVFLSGNAGGGTPPGTLAYDAATNTFTYTSSGPLVCTAGLGWDIYISGTASANGTPDPVGDTISNTATASWTYTDGVTGSSTHTVNTTVVAIVPTPFLSKGAGTQSIGNAGQYTFPPNGQRYTYTYPGNWNRSGASVDYTISLATNGASAGAEFAVHDPLPCLNNFAGQVYSSPAPGGPYCTAPAFIPTLIPVPSGFTATAADAITLVYTDGSSATVPYVAGTGWTIPPSPAVAEIDIPQFAEEASNTTTMAFTVDGYAAPSVSTTSLLTNTVTANAYAAGNTTPVVPQETSANSVMAVSPAEPSGTVIQPGIGPVFNGNATCTESLYFVHPAYGTALTVEFASAPSQAIYIDVLAPVGATVTGGQTNTFTISGAAGTTGGPYTTAAIAATVTNNYNGTGRVLLQWLIPAGTITLPGDYTLTNNQVISVSLGPGCDGIYENDTTVGYGAPITGCLGGSSITPPSNPTADSDLKANAAPTPGNYCGHSSPINVTAVNPAFSVNKSVQGNLDAAPVTGGGIGNVSPDGGTASYDVTFTNTGEANLANPVMYDLLPAVGDTYATSTAARGSQFPVTLTSVGPVPANVTVYYSTAANPCRPQVLPTNSGCVSNWTTTPPSPLSSVRALEFTYTGTVYVTGATAGTSTFSVPFTVSTPNGINGEVAWNTIGTTATQGAGGAQMTPAESSRTGLQAAQSVLGLVKSVTSPTGPLTAAGQVISYAFKVTNSSGVLLSGIAVTDTQATPAGGLTTGPTCPQPTLAAGASETCTATYTVTQADIDNGSVDDTATASGTPPSGTAVTSPPSDVSLPATAAPAISIVKSASVSDVAHFLAGQVITYTFVVTNTGNVTLAPVTVTDTGFTGTGTLSPVSCPPGGTGTVASLAPGAQAVCTATYTLTTADVDAGHLADTGNAAGAPPSGPAVTGTSTIDIPAAQNPAVSIVKSASPGTVQAAGDVVTYSFTVTNTGNATLDSVAVTDTQQPPAGGLDGPVTCPDTTLAPGQFTTCTATYTVTQADIDHGSVDDSATASGSPPSGPAVTSPSSAVSVPVPAGPAINIVKSGTPAQVHAAGDVVTYRFTVTNTGTDTLTGVAVADTQAPPAGSLDGPVTCPDTTLAPGASTTCSATYTLTQADIDNGGVADTATASGSPPSGPAVTSPAVSLAVAAPQAPAVTVVKSTTTTSVTRAGQQVPYSFLVTNTGNVPLAGVTVTDTVAAPSDTANLSPVACPAPVLAPGVQETCTATYTATQADVDHGRLGDSATVTGTPPATPGNPSPSPLPPSPASAVTVPVVQHPGISLVKTGVKDPVTAAGELFRYSFLVGNTGNVTLRAVGVNDVMLPPASQANLSPVTCPRTTLAPGASMTCTATYTAAAADVGHSSLGNTATAFGTPPSGVVIRSRPHTFMFTATGRPVAPPGGPILIPTGEGASAAPGASPALAAAGAAALAAGTAMLLRQRRRRRA